MFKNKSKKEEVMEVVDQEVANETEATPKKRLNVKKVVGVGLGVLAAGVAVGATIIKRGRADKALSEYMESCGNEGTDLPDDDPELKELLESETASTEE